MAGSLVSQNIHLDVRPLTFMMFAGQPTMPLKTLDNPHTLKCEMARLKQEEVYRRAYETVAEARKGIADYLRYFNEERPHQGLDNRTPDDVFYKRKPLAKAA